MYSGVPITAPGWVKLPLSPAACFTLAMPKSRIFEQFFPVVTECNEHVVGLEIAVHDVALVRGL